MLQLKEVYYAKGVYEESEIDYDCVVDQCEYEQEPAGCGQCGRCFDCLGLCWNDFV